ncbi:MAG TPA: alpha/beta fold hydrolase [Thermoanaerobaculia bacterium]|nr:alpha/beta fold hydrolase [Thermoanaerobaculia bacterium]
MRVKYQFRNVEVREEGSGPAVVLVHGYPLDGDMWSDVSRRLAPKFRVLRPDLPSRRDTPHPPQPSMAEYAGWIAAVADAAGGKVGIAGFSMGGYVLFELLRARPEVVAAAAFVDTQGGADDGAGRQARNRAIFTAREMGPSAVSDGMIPKLLSAGARSRPDLVARVRAIVRRQNPNSIENDLLAMRDRADSLPSLGTIAVPALVLVGSEDAITPVERAESIARGIPGAELVTVPGAGHLSPMENPDAVAAALSSFFAKSLA